MIEPTVGRVVLFRPASTDHILQNTSGQPLAAIIAHVHSNRCVNLAVFDANGLSHSRTSATLIQDDDKTSEYGYYAEWMPFQKGQAAKADTKLESEVERVAALIRQHGEPAVHIALQNIREAK